MPSRHNIDRPAKTVVGGRTTNGIKIVKMADQLYHTHGRANAYTVFDLTGAAC